jgi:hypothetical protein
MQVALAALIADWAIQRVVDQKHFHDAFTRLFGPFGISMDNHIVAASHGTGRHRFWGPFQIDEAHAAVGRNA